MTHSTTSQVFHEETVPNGVRSGTQNSNKVQVHMNRQPDLIPERTHARVPVCGIYSASVGLWNT